MTTLTAGASSGGIDITLGNIWYQSKRSTSRFDRNWHVLNFQSLTCSRLVSKNLRDKPRQKVGDALRNMSSLLEAQNRAIKVSQKFFRGLKRFRPYLASPRPRNCLADAQNEGSLMMGRLLGHSRQWHGSILSGIWTSYIYSKVCI